MKERKKEKARVPDATAAAVGRGLGRGGSHKRE
jgi:hypothetical protein